MIWDLYIEINPYLFSFSTIENETNAFIELMHSFKDNYDSFNIVFVVIAIDKDFI